MTQVNVSLVVYGLLACAVATFMVVGTYVLGQRHHEKATNKPFESGIVVTGNARIRFPAHFYMVAMLFVVFDLESIFLYAWSLIARSMGIAGLIQAGVFIVILLIALLYVVRGGALNFGPRLRKGQP